MTEQEAVTENEKGRKNKKKNECDIFLSSRDWKFFFLILSQKNFCLYFFIIFIFFYFSFFGSSNFCATKLDSSSQNARRERGRKNERWLFF